MDSWHPAADQTALLQRARILHDVRTFFAQRNVLEVETPVLVSAGVTDPSIASLSLHEYPVFLHTSPEYAMKRLLCAGSGDIYQVARVFREGESGRHHNPEFSLLEWYRLGFDTEMLANEVIELIEQVAQRSFRVESIAYAELFASQWNIDINSATVAELEALAEQESLHPGTPLDFDAWLDLLLSLGITAKFPADRLTIVRDFPASQAALARLHPNGQTAVRFEVFWGAIELANGYHELAEVTEQRQRFESENARRLAAGLSEMPVDERFLAALQSGFPDCSGVALGLDRLLMRVSGADAIQDVLAFPFDRA